MPLVRTSRAWPDRRTRSFYGQRIVQTSGTGGGNGVGVLPLVAAAGGPVGLAVAGASLLASFSGTLMQMLQPDAVGISKLNATTCANYFESLLKENLKAYQAGVGTQANHFISHQTQALQNFEAIFQAMVQCCMQAGSVGGQRCVNDRIRGGQYDYYVKYKDPIANDASVKPDPIYDSLGNEIQQVQDPETGQWKPVQSAASTAATTATAAVSGLVSALPSFGTEFWVVGGLVLVGAVYLLASGGGNRKRQGWRE
jgi:hypothetical protein